MGDALLLFNISRPQRLTELSNMTQMASRTLAGNSRAAAVSATDLRWEWYRSAPAADGPAWTADYGAHNSPAATRSARPAPASAACRGTPCRARRHGVPRHAADAGAGRADRVAAGELCAP